MPEIYKAALETVKGIKNVTVFNRGVFDQSGEMIFTSYMPYTAKRLHPGRDVSVMISTILQDIAEKITFIKMDVESAEPNALLGAIRHIVEDHPDLAICVYRTVSDVRTIPQIIYDINPDPKFYLRHHAKTNVEETVFYASPINDF